MKFIFKVIIVAILLALVIAAFCVVVLSFHSFVEWSWRPFVDFYVNNILGITAKSIRVFGVIYTAICIFIVFVFRKSDGELRY